MPTPVRGLRSQKYEPQFFGATTFGRPLPSRSASSCGSPPRTSRIPGQPVVHDSVTVSPGFKALIVLPFAVSRFAARRTSARSDPTAGAENGHGSSCFATTYLRSTSPFGPQCRFPARLLTGASRAEQTSESGRDTLPPTVVNPVSVPPPAEPTFHS